MNFRLIHRVRWWFVRRWLIRKFTRAGVSRRDVELLVDAMERGDL
jgi:hypothetical protein